MFEGRHLSVRKLIRFILVVVAIIVAIIFIKPKNSPKTHLKKITQVPVSELSQQEIRAMHQYTNEMHLEVARSRGMTEPLASKADFDNNQSQYIVDYKLRRIYDNSNYYKLQGLTMSIPYMQRDAVDFLTTLGKEFKKNLEEAGIQPYRYGISSVLRTIESQNKLREKNVNATKNMTSHYYGRSFDIPEEEFYEVNDDKVFHSKRLRNILIRTLLDLQAQEKCYIIQEKATKCIHVTVK